MTRPAAFFAAGREDGSRIAMASSLADMRRT